MKTSLETSRRGFTIIEVVLVLAIAGLIFLMVFVAAPALQRTRRDTQRRDDYANLSSLIANYATNNGNLSRLLTNGDPNEKLDPARYINSTGLDPNDNKYDLKVYSYDKWASLADGTPKENENTSGSQVFVVLTANCTGSNVTTGAAMPAKDKSRKAYAVYGYMESGDQTFCLANESSATETMDANNNSSNDGATGQP